MASQKHQWRGLRDTSSVLVWDPYCGRGGQERLCDKVMIEGHWYTLHLCLHAVTLFLSASTRVLEHTVHLLVNTVFSMFRCNSHEAILASTRVLEHLLWTLLATCLQPVCGSIYLDGCMLVCMFGTPVKAHVSKRERGLVHNGAANKYSTSVANIIWTQQFTTC